jgi:hypothetical protein
MFIGTFHVRVVGLVARLFLAKPTHPRSFVRVLLWCSS